MMRGLFMMLLIFAADAWAATPGETAMRFAEAVRDDKFKADIIDLCRLNPDTGDLKKSRIYADWQSLGKVMLDVPFVVVEEKILNDHAAVVLSQRKGTASQSQYVCSIAMVRDADSWKPAPVFSSFENSIVSYDTSILETRQNLVHWMIAREQSAGEQIIADGKREFDEAMRRSITPEQLKNTDPTALLRGFIQATRDRNSASAIARIGGYSADLETEIAATRQRIVQAFESTATMDSWPWKLLTDPRTIIVIGDPEQDGNNASLTLVALHPDSGMEQPQVISFDIAQAADATPRLKLPAIFTTADVREAEMANALRESDTTMMAVMKKFLTEKRQAQPPDLHSSAESFAKYFTRCLAENDFTNFWVAAVPENIFDADGTIPELGDLWQSLHQSSETALFALVACKQEGRHACFVLQSYSPRDGLRLQDVWLENINQQWKIPSSEPKDPPAALTEWIEQNAAEWKKTIALTLTDKAQRIGALAAAPVDTDAVRTTFDLWRKAMDQESLNAALPYCASFNDEASTLRMLRNLSGDITYDSGKRSVLQVHNSGRWAAVSARLDPNKMGEKPQFPLHIFVTTDAGPRLLPQVDYRIILCNASRDFLNKNSLRELEKHVPAQAIAELQTIIDAHKKNIDSQPLIPTTPSAPAK